MKKLIRPLVSTILLTFLLSFHALSDEVKMYTDRIPPADEMADILLNKPKTSGLPPYYKSRSIAWNTKKQNTNTRIGLPINFEFNSSVLTDKSVAYVNQIGHMMNLEKIRNEKLMIIGHTDASGSEIYNASLSEIRAQAVKDFLINKFNIDDKRINIAGKGEQEPLQGKDPFDPLNRRVEIFLIK